MGFIWGCLMILYCAFKFSNNGRHCIKRTKIRLTDGNVLNRQRNRGEYVRCVAFRNASCMTSSKSFTIPFGLTKFFFFSHIKSTFARLDFPYALRCKMEIRYDNACQTQWILYITTEASLTNCLAFINKPFRCSSSSFFFPWVYHVNSEYSLANLRICLASMSEKRTESVNTSIYIFRLKRCK